MNVLHWEQLSKKKNEEIAQLKARVAELEEAIDLLRSDKPATHTRSGTSFAEKRAIWAAVNEIVKRAPAQSLAEIQAQALEVTEKEFRKMGYPRAADNLMVLARDIRQQAKGE